jgi:hypothetical protein
MSFLLQLKVGFRVGLRRKFGPCVTAGAHDQVYLKQFPWLLKIIPIGMTLLDYRSVEDNTRRGSIVVKRLDETFAGQRLHCGRGAYLIDKGGDIVRRLGDMWFDYTWDRVLTVILRLPAPDEIAFVARVYGHNDSGRVEIFKMPRNMGATLLACAIFRRSEEAQTKTAQSHQNERAEAARKAREEINTALSD